MGCLLKTSGLYNRMTVGAVLLAAGAASRLGGRPKALLQLGGVPLVVRQLVALSGAGVDEVVVVLGHHADAVEAAIGSFPITVVRNPAPDEGQASSVRLGLAALSPKLDAALVALADMPLVDAQDIVALIAAYRKRGPASMVVPRVRQVAGAERAAGAGAALAGEAGEAGEVGNPIIFDAALREAWLAGEADLACRKWRQTHPDRVAWFDTDNRRYAIDIDTPEDLERFAAGTGHRLAWPAGLELESAPKRRHTAAAPRGGPSSPAKPDPLRSTG